MSNMSNTEKTFELSILNTPNKEKNTKLILLFIEQIENIYKLCVSDIVEN